MFGARAAAMLTSVIALALVSSVSAMVMAGPRVYTAMATDRALPPQLGFHSKRGVPTVAVIAQGVLGAGFALLGKFDELVRFIGFTLAIFAALTVGAVFVFRHRGHGATYKTWGYPVTPFVFIGFSMWIVYVQVKDRPGEAGIVGLVLVAGAVLYAVASRNRPPSIPEARAVTSEKA
jgi:APA family basic amino acid/polyamine antiporter